MYLLGDKSLDLTGGLELQFQLPFPGWEAYSQFLLSLSFSSSHRFFWKIKMKFRCDYGSKAHNRCSVYIGTLLLPHPIALSLHWENHVHNAVSETLGKGKILFFFLVKFLYLVYTIKKGRDMLWLVWLSGLRASLWTKGSLVRFLVRAHAWVVCQVPRSGRMRGNHTLMLLTLSFSFPSPLAKNK